MKLTIQNDKDSTIKFKVTAELDEKDLAKQKAKALKKLGEGVKVPGFRSGTAPDKLIEENIILNQHFWSLHLCLISQFFSQGIFELFF